MNNPRNLAKLGMYGISANYQIVFFGVWGGCSGIFRTPFFFTAGLIGHFVHFDLYLVFFYRTRVRSLAMLVTHSLTP